MIKVHWIFEKDREMNKEMDNSLEVKHQHQVRHFVDEDHLRLNIIPIRQIIQHKQRSSLRLT
jgi:hypothetical protein